MDPPIYECVCCVLCGIVLMNCLLIEFAKCVGVVAVLTLNVIVNGLWWFLLDNHATVFLSL